jgi:hypothetical protein
MGVIGAIPPQPEAEEPTTTADGDASTAAVAWADFGSAMGNGREIELPKVLMPFFGIGEGTASPQLRNFVFPGGISLPIPIVRREDNGMWRIIFRRDVPGSDALRRLLVNGVRQRSDRAVEFRRTNVNAIETRFVQLGTAEYQNLVGDSQQQGTFGRTIPGPRGKSYGFY